MSTGAAATPGTGTLAEQILAAVAAPLQRDDAIDLPARLDEVLADVGLHGADCGGEITFEGADPIAASRLALASSASLGLVAKSVAIAHLHRVRGGEGQDIAMDLRVAPRRLCPFYEGRWELLNGMPQGGDFDIETALKYTNFYRCADGRWVLPQAHYPKLRNAGLRFLGVPDDKAAIAAAIGARESAELEAAGAEAGIVMPVVRSAEEFLAEEHYAQALAGTPLIELERIGDADPVPLAASDQPLDGIRALGLAKVIAGGGIGRTLALHGADVLNVWRPTDYESAAIHHTAQYGVRSTRLPWRHEKGLAKLHELVRGADVLYTNRRPGLIAELGLDPDAAAALRPGIVHATVSLHGLRGPWAGRPGFDQTAGSVTGMMELEGDRDRPRVPVINVVNDWIVPWLVTAGVASALARRAQEGGSWRVHVSLTRVALWALSLGVFDREYVAATAGTGELHEYREPELFTEDSVMGRYQGVTEQVRMSATPGYFRHGLLPLGAAAPAWLPRD
jgi:crotonobetainyl-CoA:carnitine CoA-transferase CaiB-like acyl-CoA transferase